jgi:predicted transposase/invertase (TIGR01784 family)
MIGSARKIMGQHDLSYRLFFSHRRMIQALLQEIVGERWVELIDFNSGELVDTTFISPQHEKRESDLIWRFRRKDSGELVFVYILMEFQSRPDPSMPARFMSYLGMLYQRLMKNRSRKAWRKLPLVLPMVVYNGEEPWDVSTDLGSLIGYLDPSAEIYRPQLRYLLVDESSYSSEELTEMANPVAELFQIEKSRTWWEIRWNVDRLRHTIPPDEVTLRRAFETWLAKVVLPRLSAEEAFEILTLEEIETVLAERIDRWNRELQEKGRQEGRQEATAQVLLRQLHLKFGPLAPEVEERVRSTDADRLLEWSERILTSERLEEVFGD